MKDDYTFQMEYVSDVKQEMTPLLEDHWEEIAVHKDKIKLNVDWDTYLKLESSGDLGLYTVRHKGVLVGYLAVVCQINPHYKDHIYAVTDVIFVKEEHRNAKVGFTLLDFAEKDLKERGVSVFVVNTKTHKPFDALLEGMSFDLIERVYSKYLGD